MSSTGSNRAVPLIVLLAAAVPSAMMHGQEQIPIPPPGFRPSSPHAVAFVESLGDANVVVLPTVVRGPEGSTHSRAAQRRIVDLLDRAGWDVAAAWEPRVHLGAVPFASQWDVFQNSLRRIAGALREWRTDADYVLVMEVLLEPGDRAVWGIETYVVDREGRNVFSFLLNSHHEPFAAADLVATDETEDARAVMIAGATEVGLAALETQVEHARACGAYMAAHPAKPMGPGVFQDFESGLPAASDPYGVPVGFSTFSDGRSDVKIDTTSSHPERPGEPAGNRTLRIDLDVTGWAGLVYLVEEGSPPGWGAQDWTAFEGLSFWMYGSNTGTGLFVDLLDNRHPCSTADDAERYVYEFSDDFSGWRKVFVPFRDMVRKETGNDAPNDGLGLGRVHGWAFGATTTGGARTWYLDDVALWSDGAGRSARPACATYPASSFNVSVSSR
jgi:hypothetical protein